MNKRLKKILITGASLLMMASIGIGFSQTTSSHVTAYASRTVSIPSRYWGTWRGNETQRGRATTFTMKLGRRNGYYHSSRYDNGPVVYTRSGKSFRRMGLRYNYWPYGKTYEAAPCGFGLHGHTLHVSEDTTIWYLHRIHRHHVMHHRKYVSHHHVHKHYRKHIRKHTRKYSRKQAKRAHRTIKRVARSHAKSQSDLSNLNDNQKNVLNGLRYYAGLLHHMPIRDMLSIEMDDITTPQIANEAFYLQQLDNYENQAKNVFTPHQINEIKQGL